MIWRASSAVFLQRRRRYHPVMVDDLGVDLALLQDFQSGGVSPDSLHPVGQLRRDLEHFLIRS
jgi:hypothetical protein